VDRGEAGGGGKKKEEKDGVGRRVRKKGFVGVRVKRGVGDVGWGVTVGWEREGGGYNREWRGG